MSGGPTMKYISLLYTSALVILCLSYGIALDNNAPQDSNNNAGTTDSQVIDPKTTTECPICLHLLSEHPQPTELASQIIKQVGDESS